MKFTKSQIEQIIKEELDKIMELRTDAAGAPAAAPPTAAPAGKPKEKLLSAVERIRSILPAVKSKKEYAQLIQLVLRHQLPQEGDSSRGLLLALGNDTATANMVMKAIQPKK